ncbi:SRPBCC domain-containing protein [uncultured Alistipes sp.]|uniref:SRPBCC domain-containing protein n=1 Tax=uncultured Alistipes sp. TaxID=538949 RepID=UPI002608A14E|nr:SRPBCC domain-containing protein [uncultured Alistipes sp.]
MQEYTSRQQQIRRPAQQIYTVVSRFDNLTPAVADKVEEWQATEDTCSFKAKGFTVKLRMAEKEEPKLIKIVGDDGGVPMDFAFWLQLKEVAPDDTRMRLVLHIELNMMMRMMVGSKLQEAVDKIAEAVAQSFNAAPHF